MSTAGALADGMPRMRPALDAKAHTSATAGAVSGVPGSDEAFGELLAAAVAVDAAIVPHANLLLDAAGAVMNAPLDGNVLPEGGRLLPHLLSGLTSPGEAGPGTMPARTLDLKQSGGAQAASVLAEALERRAPSRDAIGEFVLQHGHSQETSQRPAAPATVPGSAPLTPGQPGFDQSLGQRLVFMVQQGVQYARVSIHPEHLGPLEIRLKLDADGAHVVLQSAHAAVRDVLEQALPRLREVLGEGGLELVDVDIGDPGQQASGRDPETAKDTTDPADPDAGDDGAEPNRASAAAPRGLLDTFA